MHYDFAILSIVESSLVTSRSNHDGRIVPSNHVQQNPGLHTTLKPAVITNPLKSQRHSFEGMTATPVFDVFQAPVSGHLYLVPRGVSAYGKFNRTPVRRNGPRKAESCPLLERAAYGNA